MSDVSDDKLREIIAGTEGVTAGPWTHYRDKLRPGFGGIINEVQAVRSPTKHVAPIVPWPGFDDSDRREAVHALNAAHIARLDPATIRSICEELLALRAARQEAKP
jgi:hypothetical protein